jgi:hypothetical protein
MEVITSMYKRKRLSKTYQYHPYSDLIVTLLTIPFIIEVVILQPTLERLLGAVLLLAVHCFSKCVLLRNLKDHITRLRVEYKDDKKSIINGKKIKEKTQGLSPEEDSTTQIA